jgi:hypothetical protein
VTKLTKDRVIDVTSANRIKLAEELEKIDVEIWRVLWAIRKDRLLLAVFPKLTQDVVDPMNTHPEGQILQIAHNQDSLIELRLYYERYEKAIQHDIPVEKHDTRGLHGLIIKAIALTNQILATFS